MMFSGSIVSALVTSVVTGLSNRFLSQLRRRQLYAFVEKPMQYPPQHMSGYFQLVTLFNKGSTKETNVILSFPFARKVDVVSSDYENVFSFGHKVHLDRLLPGSINLVLLVQAKTIGHLPELNSDDAKGKVFNQREQIPPSDSWWVVVGTVVVCVFSLMAFFPKILDKCNDWYGGFAYDYLYDQGFAFESSFDRERFNEASFTENNVPLKFVSFEILSNEIRYNFLIKNNRLETLVGDLSFIPRNQYEYLKASNQLFNEYYFSNTKKYESLTKELNLRYVYDPITVKYKVLPMTSKKISIGRLLDKRLQIQDLNLRFSFNLGERKSFNNHINIVFRSFENETIANQLKMVLETESE